MLVVGGGYVASRKAAQLAEAGARLTVVAPAVRDELVAIAAELESRVAEALDTRVSVAVPKTKKSRGKLVIEFADIEDLRRITDAID